MPRGLLVLLAAVPVLLALSCGGNKNNERAAPAATPATALMSTVTSAISTGAATVSSARPTRCQGFYSASNSALAGDCAALLALRDTLAGTAALNWSETVLITDWEGVTVGGTPIRVTALALADSGLTGQVSGLMGNLTGLTELRLNGNRLTGRLPSKLGQLTNLTHVYLAGNSFTSCLPPLLRKVTNNDVAGLGLSDCEEPIDISRSAPTLTAGTYKFIWNEGDPPLIFDVPAGLTLEVEGYVLTAPLVDQNDRLLHGAVGLILKVANGSSEVVIDVQVDGVEWSRWLVTQDPRSGAQTSEPVGDLFDRLVESSWVGEPDE